MIAARSNPRDSHYSTLFDDYLPSPPPEGTLLRAPTRNQNSMNRRPSLNLSRPRDSISTLRRQPSYDFPSPSSSSYLSSPHASSPKTSSYDYRDSRSFTPVPPSPGYIFHQHYFGEGKDRKSSITSTVSSIFGGRGRSNVRTPDGYANGDGSNSLTIPQNGRSGSRYRSPSMSGSSRPSSSSSYEDSTFAPRSPSGISNSPNRMSTGGSLRSMSQYGEKFAYGFVDGHSGDADRDQYGFKKSYQWISRKEYAEFEASYARTQHRRKVKWDALLADNGGRFPPRSKKVKRYIRKGVPPSLRGQIWFHYSGADIKLRDHPDLYEKLLLKAEDSGTQNEYVEIIERDLHRTFPENIKFKLATADDSGAGTVSTENVPIIQSLRRVLIAFSLYSPGIGYCQSLNYIAGLLLLFMEEVQAFWTLVTIIHDYLPENMYDVTMEGSNVDQAVLMMFIMEKMPSVWSKMSGGIGYDLEKLEANMPIITLVTSHWFLTLYINILPVETILRVWDCFFYEGNKVMFRVALAIFKINEEKILAVEDPMEIFQVVQNLPKGLIDCRKLMDVCFRRRRVGTDIARKDIERRREFFRERRRKRVETMRFQS